MVFRLMDLPVELRHQILAEACTPYRLWSQVENQFGCYMWASSPFFPPELRKEGLNAYYGSKKVTIELPEVDYRRKKKKIRVRWPSIFRISDQENKLALEVGPGSNYDAIPQEPGFVNLKKFGDCPFYLFSGITVNIPSHDDLVTLILNWCRLRNLGHILQRLEEYKMNLKNDPERLRFTIPTRMTPVKIVFSEKKSLSWFDKDGCPKETPELSSQLKLDGDEKPVSDLVLLLRALAPIRGQADITIETPDGLPLSEIQRQFSVAWLADPNSPKHPDCEYDYVDPILDAWLKLCERTMWHQLVLAGFHNKPGPDGSPLPYGFRCKRWESSAPLPYLYYLSAFRRPR